jgi:hypothetical protein
MIYVSIAIIIAAVTMSGLALRASHGIAAAIKSTVRKPVAQQKGPGAIPLYVNGLAISTNIRYTVRVEPGNGDGSRSCKIAMTCLASGKGKGDGKIDLLDLAASGAPVWMSMLVLGTMRHSYGTIESVDMATDFTTGSTEAVFHFAGTAPTGNAVTGPHAAPSEVSSLGAN